MYFTSTDNINIAMYDPTNNDDYLNHRYSYISMLVSPSSSHNLSISFLLFACVSNVRISPLVNQSKQSIGTSFLLLQVFWVGITRAEPSLLSVLHLLMDLIACLFSIIMILDGVVYTEYAYILSFCILVPAFLDFLSVVIYIMQRQLVTTTKMKAA